MARYERSIYTDPDPKESRMSSKEERRRADERSLAPYERKAAEMEKRGKSRGGGGGGGGMNPIDLERVPGKRPLKMKAGGSVKSSASKRADGIAIRGKTKGRMV